MCGNDNDIHHFIRRHGITMRCRQVDMNPNRVMSEWDHTASHWKCKLRCGEESIILHYRMGSAHTGEPDLANVLDCLASATESVRGVPFAEWCRDLGFDEDFWLALRTYRICDRQAEKLAVLLGPEALAELLYQVERL